MKIVDIDSVVAAVDRLKLREPRIVASGNAVLPIALVGPMLETLERARLHVLNLATRIELHDGVIPETTFVGPGFRKHPRLAYVPSRLSMVPALYRTQLPIDVLVLHTTLPRDGKVSLGIEVNVLPGALEAARARGALVVAQLNPQMPWTHGDAEIAVDQIDLGVEVEVPLVGVAPPTPGDEARVIGELIAAEISDGATLQAGIGEVPDATVAMLGARRGLRVWTELLGDGILNLENAGVLDPEAPLVTSFAFGSNELYA